MFSPLFTVTCPNIFQTVLIKNVCAVISKDTQVIKQGACLCIRGPTLLEAVDFNKIHLFGFLFFSDIDKRLFLFVLVCPARRAVQWKHFLNAWKCNSTILFDSDCVMFEYKNDCRVVCCLFLYASKSNLAVFISKEGLIVFTALQWSE